MKKSGYIVGILVMMGSFSVPVFTQNSRITSAGANIVRGITLSETSNLHFGSMSVPTAAVSVKLTTSNDRITTTPGNIELLAQAPLPQNAMYTVSGTGDATYAITLPINGAVRLTSGSEHMEVIDFVAHPASAGADALAGALNNSGSDSFTVGATLQVGEAQPYGVYAGTFFIAVNYN
ncbi:MAG: DUF4402 domain-containing protein [Bacteroidetes bacterium]|nr:DUF4402 domain-containing protein [Bacteroidota bacterium]